MSLIHVIVGTIQLSIPVSIITLIVIYINRLGHRIASKLLGVSYITLFTDWKLHFQIVKKIRDIPKITKNICSESGELTPISISIVERKNALEVVPLWKKVVVLLSGPIFSYIFAFVLLLSFQNPVDFTNEIFRVTENGPAFNVGVKAGDKIIELEGEEITDAISFVEVFRSNTNDKITMVLRDSEGKDRTVSVEPRFVNNRVDGSTMPYIGIDFRYIPKQLTLLEALEESLHNISQTMTVICHTFWHLSIDQTTYLQFSPMFIVLAIIATIFESFQGFFTIISIISVVVATINLFPIPITATGRIMFYAIVKYVKPHNVRLFKFYWYNVGFSFMAITMLITVMA